MPESFEVEFLLGQAGKREKEYDWLGAAELYEEALGMVAKEDFLKLGTIQEEIGRCLYFASMQAESREEFEERTRQDIAAYMKAEEFYENLSNEQKSGRVLRCGSVCKYLESFLTSDQHEANKLLTECLEIAGKSLAIFSESGDMVQYGITYNALSFLPLTVFFRKIIFERDRQIMKKVVEEGLHWGEKALAVLHEQGDKHQIATAYCTWITCQLLFEWFFVEEPEEQETHSLQVMSHLEKMLELSQEIGDIYLIGLTHFWLGDSTGGDESIGHMEKSIDSGKKTRDKYAEAGGMDFIANRIYWKAIVEENPDKRIELAEKAMSLYDKAQHYYSIVHFNTPRGGLICPPGGHAEHYFHLAEWETDIDKKKELLDKAENTGIQALKEAEDHYSPNVISFMLNILSRILEARSFFEPNVGEKRSILERAMKYEERAIQNSGWKPYVYWNVGLMHSFLADLKAELGYLERDPNNRRKLLEEAARSKEECLELIAKQEAPYYQVKGVRVPFIGLYRYRDTYGTLLNHLYELTSNPEYLRKSIEISKKALEWHTKLGIVSLMAEEHWKIAHAQDILQEHSAAARNFEYASECYLKAAEKIPQLEDLYQDYSSYMLAWSEIERARHHHTRQEYSRANEHFERAASLHNSLKKWNHLSHNYSACAQVELAEDLSRKEQSEEALKAFEQAAKRLNETKEALQTKIGKIESSEEKQMVAGIVKAATLRSEYCIGRVALEEAKMLDKKGDHYSSSEKYGEAAQVFEKVAHALESEQDRKELKLIFTLSKAWQKMTRAEAEASPTLYMEASQLFEEAQELSPSEKAKMLALGHSRFCRALEAGTKFTDTREATLHTTAMQHLESAANYYLKAGCQNASEYAKATGLLFDAYEHIDSAKKERDPEKKAKLYTMAEKVLQTSAGSFIKAEHPEKREQVLNLLNKVMEEQELTLSLIEVLHAPPIASATTAFTTPTPTHETAVGLERFEHADIHANVITRRKALKVGENLDLEIELVNAGKGHALLTKITEVIPESFELIQKPEVYRVEDSYLNMKGKRLDPLKTEEVNLVLKPKERGTFPLKPTIFYLDEDGKCKIHEAEPVTITVKELGIKGWIKGER